MPEHYQLTISFIVSIIPNTEKILNCMSIAEKTAKNGHKMENIDDSSSVMWCIVRGRTILLYIIQSSNFALIAN